ncbi:MAG: hypothetical protein P9L94_00550 [Candidatus Hinthialibacter antarcticus]|nr:hypothetical protein [Candidatus Hinthialibacter antarcticus]
MILSAIASFLWHGGSLDPSQNVPTVYYVVRNNSEAMRELEPEYIHYFTDVEDEIDFDALTYQKSELTAEQLERYLSEANQAVDGLQATVKAKERVSIPNQNSNRYPWTYYTYKLSNSGPINLHKREVLYSGVDHSVWQIEILHDDEGVTHISPRITSAKGRAPTFTRYIIPPQISKLEEPEYLTLQSFGRGLPEKAMKILSVSQSVERPELIKTVFEIRMRPVEYIDNSQLIKIEQFEQISVWIDVDLGYVCRRYLRNSNRVSSVWNVWRKDVDIIYSDFRQINHAWVPHIRQFKDDGGAVIEEYRIIDIQQIPDIEAFLKEVQQLPTPQPGDAFKSYGRYIRRASQPASQN